MRVFAEPSVYLSAASHSASFNGDAFEVASFYGMCWQVNITNSSSFAATMVIQQSNDIVARSSEVVNWMDYGGTACGCNSTITLSTDTSDGWNILSIVPFKWMRIKFTITAGSATIGCVVSASRL